MSETTWWLSFVDEEDTFLGVVLVDAPSAESAIERAAIMGLNPGGEVMYMDMADGGAEGMAEADDLGRNRLIDMDELRRRGYATLGELRGEGEMTDRGGHAITLLADRLDDAVSELDETHADLERVSADLERALSLLDRVCRVTDCDTPEAAVVLVEARWADDLMYELAELKSWVEEVVALTGAEDQGRALDLLRERL